MRIRGIRGKRLKEDGAGFLWSSEVAVVGYSVCRHLSALCSVPENRRTNLIMYDD